MGKIAGNGISRARIWRSILGCAALLAVAPATSYAETGAAAVGWGTNIHAELASGYRDTYEVGPVPVLGLSNITSLAVGNGFNLALLSDGTVRAWGGNMWGELGDGTHRGTFAKAANVITVHELTGVTAIAAANSHALALLANGTVKAWGNNTYGQLGNGKGGTEKATGETQTLPKTVGGLSNVIAIAAGGGSNYALLSNHTLMAWGQNTNGQLGIGETGPELCLNELHVKEACSTIPRQVVVPTLGSKGQPEAKSLTGVVSVSAGAEAAYAVLESGRVMSWGANNMGQLGTGGEPLHVNIAPQEVRSASNGQALGNVLTVSGGTFDALALLKTGEVVGWGATGKGELGYVRVPAKCKKIACVQTARPIKGLESRKVSAISAGDNYSLAVSGGKVYGFGKNEVGQLGIGYALNATVPSAIEGIGPVSGVTAGRSHAFALLQSGVQPPPPLLSVEPGIGSLKLNWTLHDEEYKVEYSRGEAQEGGTCTESEGSEAGECEESEPSKPWLGPFKLGGQAHGYEVSGLEAQPYLIIVKSIANHRLERKRVIVATPLP
ncbi:MAG TPA: hypothetical protein VK272_05485 [Solirubrobacteraceae bacterium]|nr:hypothetical protein [Solirubrobacteraceae bacterium]